MFVGSDGEGLQERMLVEEVAQHKGNASALDGPRHVLQGECNVRLLTFWLVVE